MHFKVFSVCVSVRACARAVGMEGDCNCLFKVVGFLHVVKAGSTVLMCCSNSQSSSAQGEKILSVITWFLNM